MSLLAKNLRYLRKKGDHNQEEIAILFNKRANTIGNWENQKSEPSLSELLKLANFFKVSTEDLLLSDIEGNALTRTDSPFSYRTQPPIKSPSTEVYPPADLEPGADAFWLILREIRSLHAKVDLLAAFAESAGLKRNSDKSYY